MSLVKLEEEIILTCVNGGDLKPDKPSFSYNPIEKTKCDADGCPGYFTDGKPAHVKDPETGELFHMSIHGCCAYGLSKDSFSWCDCILGRSQC